MSRSTALARLEHALAQAAHDDIVEVAGEIVEVAPTLCRAAGLSSFAALGDRVELRGARLVGGEVVRVDAAHVSVCFFEPPAGLAPGLPLILKGAPVVSPHLAWRGRVIDALARPLDGGGPLLQGQPRPLDAAPPAALIRGRITTPLVTGVRAVDVFTPLCLGQRIGIFAGSGVGKSTLLAMLAQAAAFNTVVVALVGERGREVREFLEGSLARYRDRTVAVIATADESAMMRRLAARTAMCVAETFRDAGQSVLLIVDSITRHAQATREIGLAAGEPPVARGFPPSVFADLPRLLERAGPGCEGADGTITALFAVLVDGDDHNDPIADAIRGTLDGHIVLDRAIADSGRYPAIDLLRSLSRVAQIALTPDQRRLAARLRTMVSRFEDTRDLRAMGGYTKGADAQLDGAVALVPALYAFLTQDAAALDTDAFARIASLLPD